MGAAKLSRTWPVWQPHRLYVEQRVATATSVDNLGTEKMIYEIIASINPDRRGASPPVWSWSLPVEFDLSTLIAREVDAVINHTSIVK